MGTHATALSVENGIAIAEQVCREHRLRLTEKRKRLLVALLKAALAPHG